MKNLFVLFALTLLFSCNNDRAINGYYFANYPNRIFYFANNESSIYNLSDSIHEQFNYKIISKAKLRLNGVNYFYKSSKDSLVLFDYEPKRLTLKKFYIDKISIDDLKSTSWVFDMSKNHEGHNMDQLKQISLRIDHDLNIHTVENKDTLQYFNYTYSDKLFDEFINFNASNRNAKILPIELDSENLKILLFNYGSFYQYHLKKVN